MKKIVLVVTLSLASLCLVFTSSGCGALIDYCNLTGPPNAPWIVVYTNHLPPLVRTGNVRPDGTFKAPKLGWNCSQVGFAVRFGNNFNVALSASPASVYLPSPPASGTMSGQSFDATYGMPRVDYFDSNGYLIGSANATSVTNGGTSLQANMPDLSYVYSGTYQVKVTNMTSEGHYLDIVGSASMTGWGRDRTDSDGDGWYDDEDCSPYDPYLNTNCDGGCGGGGTTYGPPYEAPTFCQY
jgi:hypothetical protein